MSYKSHYDDSIAVKLPNGKTGYRDHKGIVYRSKTEFATAYGFLSWSTIQKRLAKGYTLEQALTAPTRAHVLPRKPTRCRPNEKLRKICSVMCLDYYTVEEDIKNGATMDQALDVWDIEAPFTFRGKVYLTFHKLYKGTGVPVFRLRDIFRCAETWEARAYLISEAMQGNYHD